MSDERIELDVTLRDQASGGLDDIADKAEKVEKSDPTVTVKADTKAADADVKDLSTDVNRLDQTDWVVKVRAQLDDASAKLKLAAFGGPGKRKVKVTYLGSELVEKAKAKGSLNVIS